MRIEMIQILVCPLCKAELALEDAVEVDGLVTEGTLVCRACGERYPIEDGIPNLLPPDLRDA